MISIAEIRSSINETMQQETTIIRIHGIELERH